MRFLAEAGPWTFGWDALVAVGTIALALVTGGLVWLTRADVLTALDEAAAAWRPMVLSESHSGHFVATRDYGRSEPTMLQLVVPIQNVGRGPALEIFVTVTPSLPAPPQYVPVLRAHDDFSVSGTQMSFYLDISGENGGPWVLEADYKDLGGRSYTTRLMVSPVGSRQDGLPVTWSLESVALGPTRRPHQSAASTVRMTLENGAPL